MATCLKIAVIGAGIGGLGAARELQREGHRVVVFEKTPYVGGTWVYDPRVELDELGLDPNREIIHPSIYLSLRTISPRHLLGFSDYAFEGKDYGDPRVFPGHEEMSKFLKDFGDKFKLTELIRFNTEVIRVERVDLNNDEWVVESKSSGLTSEETFDAVVICNGRYTEPRLADDIPGIMKWPRRHLHSHNYREPEPFRDQIVVMIGSGASAIDISKEVATLAKEVHLSSRSPDVKACKLGEYNNIWHHSRIERVSEDGTVTFQDGLCVEADVIFHCTGYKYYFPFLKTNGIVGVEDNRVGPLYQHIFSPYLGPRLSFVGLPQKVVFPLMVELQSRWIAKVLSTRIVLPSVEEMLADVEQFYQQMKKDGIPTHYTHSLDYKMDYLEWLGGQVAWPLDERIKKIHFQVLRIVIANGGGKIRDHEHEFLSL